MSFDPLALRRGLEAYETQRVAALGPASSQIEEFYDTVPLPDGFTSRVKVWRSKHQPKHGRPVILLFHGGGHISGSIEMETRPGREFAETFHALVVAASYRLAPEHKFPIGVNDCWNMTVWLAEGGARSLGGNLEAGFIVGGHSAGAHNAAIISHLALDRKLSPPVTGSFTMIPHLLVDGIVPEKYKSIWRSREDNPGGETLDDMLATWLADAVHDISDPLFSPFNRKANRTGLSPTYIQVTELDPLRDDGIVYEAELREDGLPVRLDMIPGCNHQTFCAVVDPDMDLTDLKEKTINGMKWLLNVDTATAEVTI